MGVRVAATEGAPAVDYFTVAGGDVPKLSATPGGYCEVLAELGYDAAIDALNARGVIEVAA